jgi:pyruvate dehydrogenase E2 component (dihydrolipoamide acetyltransferase)
VAEKITMPKLGFDMAEGTLIRWVRSEGERVNKGEVLAEIETDKATVEVESQASGVMLKHLVQEGTSVPVGNAIAILGEEDEEIDLETLLQGTPAEAEEVAQETAISPQPSIEPPVQGITGKEARLPAGARVSPLARRLAREHNLDLTSLQGTGQDGRIVKKDVEAAIASTGVGPLGSAVPSTPFPLPLMTTEELPSQETIEVPLSKFRSLIGRRMTSAKQGIPHFYVTADFDVGSLMNLRAELNEHLPEGEKISVNDFIVKSSALALRQFPNLNASFNNDRITRYGEINIGIAVAMEEGLLTVVLRDADRKSIRTLSNEARTIIARAREGRVRPEDVEGSTFTVSNLGMFNVENFAAIINPPQAAVLAIGSVFETPVIKEGQIVIGKRLKATISADHRVTDGAEVAQWLQVLRVYIEDPLKLLL